MELTPRRALIVYINGSRVIKALRKYGLIRYISKRMHYVVLYINRDQTDQIEEKINHLRAVRKVVPSPRPEVDPLLSDLQSLGLYHQTDEDD